MPLKPQGEARLLCRRNELPGTGEASSGMEKGHGDLRSLWPSQNSLRRRASREQILPPRQRLRSEYCPDCRFSVLWLRPGDNRQSLRSPFHGRLELEGLLLSRCDTRHPTAQENPQGSRARSILRVPGKCDEGTGTFPVAPFPCRLRCFLHGHVRAMAPKEFCEDRI